MKFDYVTKTNINNIKHRFLKYSSVLINNDELNGVLWYSQWYTYYEILKMIFGMLIKYSSLVSSSEIDISISKYPIPKVQTLAFIIDLALTVWTALTYTAHTTTYKLH